jgi:hypothetical protein
VNLYGFLGNNGVNFIDVFGFQSWSPYPGGGSILGSADASDLNDRCTELKKRQNLKIASLITFLGDSDQNGADCEEYAASGESTGCSKISIVITLPNPCRPPAGLIYKDNGNRGHAGIGVGNDFYDYGDSNNGMHWMRSYPTMDKVTKFIEHLNKSNNTIIYEYCGCKETADSVRKVMNDFLKVEYNAEMPYATCTGAVSCALGWRVPYSTPLRLANFLLHEPKNSSEARGVMPLNQCGSKKGYYGNLRWASALSEEPQWTDKASKHIDFLYK